MDFALLIVGLVFIIKSADILIDSTSKIARRYGVSTFVIGITVVAFGTSAPELVVGLVSGITRTNQLTLGNVVGSSFANTALIVGITAMIFPLTVKDTVVKREIPMLIGVQLVLAFMIMYDARLTRLEGLLLLLGFVGFMVYVIKNAKKSLHISMDSDGDIDTDDDGNALEENDKTPERSFARLCLLSALSLIGLFVGGKLAVDSSTNIATLFGLNETIIGLTVVATATTLPELITSLMAVKKREPDIVLGNCVGSNLFNILLVLGVSSVIHPISVQENMTGDMLYMVLLTVFVFVISLFKKQVSRLYGVILMVSYACYISFKVIMVFVS